MKKILLFASFLLLFASHNIHSQGKNLVTVNWDINFPTSDLHNFLNNEDISLAGISFDYRYMFSENTSVGFYFAWDFFNGSDRGLTSLDNTDVSGLRLFYVNYLPFMLSGHYYLGESGGTRAYFGGGLGAVRSLQRTEIGTLSIENNNWHFGLYPEIGILIPFSTEGAVSIGGKYNVAFETSDSITYSYFSINIGITGIFDY